MVARPRGAELHEILVQNAVDTAKKDEPREPVVERDKPVYEGVIQRLARRNEAHAKQEKDQQRAARGQRFAQESLEVEAVVCHAMRVRHQPSKATERQVERKFFNRRQSKAIRMLDFARVIPGRVTAH